MQPQQLPLDLGMREQRDLDSFVPGENAVVVDLIRRMIGERLEPQLFLWGAAGSGKSHLLQGACAEMSRQGGMVAYLPLEEFACMGSDVLEGLETMDLVCVDDVEHAAGNPVWEQGLFGLINRVRDAGGRLIFAADAPPDQLGIQLPDLVSRLGWGPVFRMVELDDEGKVEALQRRAGKRGLELPPEVAGFVLRRYPRDLSRLFDLLDTLDNASLAAQRRLTVPFVKSVLES